MQGPTLPAGGLAELRACPQAAFFIPHFVIPHNMSTGRIFGLWFSYLHTTCNGSSVPPQQPRPIHATPPPQQTAASASASVAVAVAVVVAVAATSASTVAVIVTVSPSPPPLPPHFLPCIQLIVVCAPHRRCCCRCLHRCRRRCHNRRCCRHRHRRPRRPLCRCSVTVAIPVPTAIAAALTIPIRRYHCLLFARGH